MTQMFVVTPQDIPNIISLARQTWQATYSSIISQEQIDFMLAKFYNETLLLEQLYDAQHYFYKAVDDEKNQLLGYSHCVQDGQTLKLSKLYILPEAQGKQIGKQLLDQVGQLALEQNCHTLQLNVNRNNPAYYFYLKMGFTVVDTVDIPLDKFVLNDYVMEKKITPRS
jgi:diamine N-acetyltransferase